MTEHDRDSTPDYETRDVPARLPFGIIAFMVLFVPLGLLIVWALMTTVWRMAPEPDSPFAGPRSEMQGPRLQADPTRDYAAFSRDIERQLNSVGWVNREAGIVHIPIEQAKRALLRRGLPDSGQNVNPPRESIPANQKAGDSAAKPERAP
ncbi:hypothetical protein L861_00210 [Litchfieldella anticariensis FP35 = DSM 16096]|uniref:Uncharacterized protein n=1 Tax=Litchfieldella anticariensis (strain DSM 16096 / CECT 5854 / CIP 108499 / LMG 22089 / FP35) TaxID=1121939 RepID=S2KNT6_LITA3|nr:hypothetical protein [Halomonas anticariensis]EPC03752.1 hypothetical protein L861_00210 [Halomonas anticariensis FP35 = DSM 16096]